MENIIKVVLTLMDPYDYESYVEASRKANIQYWSLGDYGQKVGLLMLAMRRYPEELPFPAFMRLLQELHAPKPLVNSSRPCCGGGKTV